MASARLLLGILVTAGSLFLLADARQVREFEAQRQSTALPQPSAQSPLDTFTALPAARHASREWRANPERAKAILAETARHYPLDPLPWLTLARIKASQDEANSSTLTANLEAAAAVAAGNRSTLWLASQIALQANDLALAETYLKRWVAPDARAVEQALMVARRWIRDPEVLLTTLLPDSEPHLSEAMQFAVIQRDSGLADAVWQRVRSKQTLDSGIFLDYAESLLTRGELDALVRLWDDQDRYYHPGDIANGSFARELGEPRGLNWRINNTPSGVRILRDLDEYQSAPASLKLEFLGTNNLRLASPRIQIPLEGGGRYVLEGYWRARGLTTRGRPYLHVQMSGARTRPTLAVPGPQFEWTDFALEFEVPEGSRMIQLSVRRDPVQAFDRDISGSLWIDDLSIRSAPIDEAEPPPT
jgi:hypothetical protein